MPWLSAFPELNIRTYVSIQGRPGVWFFSLDATNPVAVRIARTFFHLPYRDAQMSLKRDGEWYQYRSQRTEKGYPKATFVGQYRPIGEVFHAQPGTLEYWLTARYCLYTADRRGRLLRGEIDHAPWPLQRAELETETNTMFNELSLRSEGEPHVLFCKDIAVKAWLNQRVREYY